MYYPEKCMGCGRCSGISPEDTGFVCLNGAKRICGREMTPDAVMHEVVKDSVFYSHSGGGLTLSGGEPLFQPDFAIELLRRAKAAGIHTALETCGFARADVVQEAAEYTDLFLYDYKETDSAMHRAFTGADNAVILENLQRLDEMGKDIILRCPIIPGYNDRVDHFAGIGKVASRFGSIRHIEIEPYHAFGETKYAALGLQACDIKPMSSGCIAEIMAFIQRETCVPVKQA